MIVSLAQVQAFGTCLLVGLGLGLLYDLLRPLRLASGRWLGGALDLGYWLCVVLTAFVCLLGLDEGHLRVYLLAALLLGAAAWFLGPSPLVRRGTAWVGRILARLLRPIRRAAAKLTGPLTGVLRRGAISLKKHFPFRRDRSTMIYLERLRRRGGSERERSARVPNETGWVDR